MAGDDGYSNDVEIDDNNELVAARDIAEGEEIAIPLHMFSKARADVVMADMLHWGVSVRRAYGDGMRFRMERIDPREWYLRDDEPDLS